MQLGLYWHIAVADFGLIYLLLAVIPFCILNRMRSQERRWIFGLAAIFFCLSIFMVIVVNPTNDAASCGLGKVFFAASHLVLAIFSGLGLMLFGLFVTASRRGSTK